MSLPKIRLKADAGEKRYTLSRFVYGVDYPCPRYRFRNERSKFLPAGFAAQDETVVVMKRVSYIR